MRLRQVQLGLSVVTTFGAGCTSWSRLSPGAPVPARGTIEVWSSGRAVLLRDAETLRDSLVGRQPLPDTARSAVALTSIDSLRAQTTDIGKSLIVGTALGIALVFAYAEGLGGME
jgi:hypothetical protein